MLPEIWILEPAEIVLRMCGAITDLELRVYSTVMYEKAIAFGTCILKA